MNSDEKFLLLRHYDLWCQLIYEEYTHMNVAPTFYGCKKWRLYLLRFPSPQ